MADADSDDRRRGASANLAVVIPGNAQVGAYSDTLTFTSAPLA